MGLIKILKQNWVMTHSSMAFECIQETFVLKLPGLRLEEGVGKTLGFLRGVSRREESCLWSLVMEDVQFP